jgi:hypothetical protein
VDKNLSELRVGYALGGARGVEGPPKQSLRSEQIAHRVVCDGLGTEDHGENGAVFPEIPKGELVSLCGKREHRLGAVAPKDRDYAACDRFEVLLLEGRGLGTRPQREASGGRLIGMIEVKSVEV